MLVIVHGQDQINWEYYDVFQRNLKFIQCAEIM